MEVGVARMRRRPTQVFMFLMLLTAAFPLGTNANAEDAAAALVVDAQATSTTPAPSPVVTAIGVMKDKTGTQIVISGDAPLPYEYFVIGGKSLVIDIPGASSTVWPAEQRVDNEFVNRIQFATHAGDKPGVRIALALNKADSFVVQNDNGKIVIVFTSPVPGAVTSNLSTPPFTEALSLSGKTAVESTSLTMAKPSGLSDDSAQSSPKPPESVLITQVVPRSSRGEIDASHLFTRVSKGSNLLLLDPNPNPNPNANDNSGKNAAKPEYVGRKVTLDFEDADLKDVFQPIADISGFNIVFGDEVKGRRTIHMEQVQWDQALDIILKTNNPELVQFIEPNNIIRITTVPRVQEAEKVELDKKTQAWTQITRMEIGNSEKRIRDVNAAREAEKESIRNEIFAKGLTDRTFLISYGDIEAIRSSILEITGTYNNLFSTVLKTDDKAMLDIQRKSETAITRDNSGTSIKNASTASYSATEVPGVHLDFGSCPGCVLTIDRRTNTIFIRSYPYYIDQIAAAIAALDMPTPSIVVEARIVEVQTDFTQNLGIQWGGKLVADPAHGNATPYAFPNSVSLRGTQDSNYLVNLPASNPVGGIALSLGHIANTFTLDLQLSALESLGKTKVLSNPKLLTQQNHKAQIKIGDELPIVTRSTNAQNGDNTSTIMWKPVGILLEVTPRTTYDNKINLDVKVTKSSKGPDVITTEGVNFSIVSNEVATKVLIDDGATAVIGGLYT